MRTGRARAAAASPGEPGIPESLQAPGEAVAPDPFAVLSDVLDFGVLVVGRPGRLDYASPLARALLGCHDDADLAVRWTALKERLASQLEEGPPNRLPRRLHASVPLGGEERSFRLEVHPLAGKRSGHLVLLKDRRSMDRLETELLLASQMRSLAHEHRVLAHDLKAPLNSIHLTLELLADSFVDEDAGGGAAAAGGQERRARHFGVLQEELARLNRILNSALDPREPLGVASHRFDLREVIREIARLLLPQARRQRVDLAVQLPEETVKVSGYRERIKQALLNIALNGLNAMPGGGRLAIVVSARNAVAGVAMEDQGRGIPEGLLDEVYGVRFPVRDGPGGMTLYAARLVAESHGGDLEVESCAGRGARYRFTLPLADAPPA